MSKLKCRYFEWDNSCLNLEGAFCGWYQSMIIIIDATSHIYHVTYFTIVMPALIVAQASETRVNCRRRIIRNLFGYTGTARVYPISRDFTRHDFHWD